MTKKQAFGLVIIFVSLILMTAALLYIFPRQTPIDVTLEAVKLDAEGDEIGTAQLHITGRYVNYFFLEDKLELTMDPVDGLTQIGKFEDASFPHSLGNETGTEYWEYSMPSYNPNSNSIEFGNLVFTEEFDRIAYLTTVSGQDICYVGSVSAEYTTQELIDYFNGIVPGK